MFKKYFTLPEAAEILTDKLPNTKVSEIDLLLAAKDGNLTLSLVFQKPPVCLITARMESPSDEEIDTVRAQMRLDYVNGEPYQIELKRTSVHEYDGVFDIEYLGDAKSFFANELNKRGFPAAVIPDLFGRFERGGLYFKRKDCDGYFKPAKFTPLYPPPQEPAQDAEKVAFDDYQKALADYSIRAFSASFWIHEYPKTLDDLENATLVVKSENIESLIDHNQPPRPTSTKTANKQSEIIAVMARMILGDKEHKWSKKQLFETLAEDIQNHAKILGWNMTLSAETLKKYIEEGEERLKP